MLLLSPLQDSVYGQLRSLKPKYGVQCSSQLFDAQHPLNSQVQMAKTCEYLYRFFNPCLCSLFRTGYILVMS